MKILFALDPWIYRNVAGNQIYTLENIFANTISALSKSGHDVRLMIGEDMLYTIKNKNLSINCVINTVNLQDLYKIFPNHYEAHKLQFNKSETNEQMIGFSKLIHKTLKGWTPEYIISFTTPVSAWQSIFPNALCLQFENGIFSREPYPYLCQLDPFGFLKNSYPAIFLNELRNQEINQKQYERVANFKDKFIEQVFSKHNPMTRDEFCDGKYEKLLLVPLSYNGVVINDEASEFKNQLDFLLHVLYRTPKNVRILVTKHSLQMDRSLNPDTEKFLIDSFPNLMFSDKFDKYAFASQWLTPIVDAVVTLNSTIAYHAALWGKKVFTIGNCEINSVATATNLNNIEEVLSKPDTIDKKALNAIYHLLTRYCFPLSLFNDVEWINKRLKDLNNIRETNNMINWDCLPLINQNEDEIFDSLLSLSLGLKEEYSPRIWNKFE